MIELEDHELSLATIEHIANDDKYRNYYESMYSGKLYSSILMALTHESFSENDAVVLWKQITSHKQHLNQLLSRDVGISVASLDYLLNIKGELSEPKIIEEDKSSYVARATTKDSLTRLYIRDVFDTILKKEIAEARRNKSCTLCLLMLDIDDFKLINDTFGHIQGDRVLERVSETISNCTREMDWAARYGGEEFAVIMPQTGKDEAFNVAERIRKSIEKLRFEEFSITISIGLCQFSKNINSPEKLIQNTDDALYQAKTEGKNRVVVHGIE